MASVITLRHVLTQRKPLVPCRSTANKNTIGRLWPEFHDGVTIWNDFNLANLNESYGHVLDFQVSEQMLADLRPDQALAGVVINRDEDLYHLICSNNAVMQPTLQFAKSHLRFHPGITLRHSYSAPDRSVLASIPDGPQRLTVDHVISLDDFPAPNLVVGLGRSSLKWSGRRLANQLDNPQQKLLWPLRQLANLCRNAQTRYGYIQTDEELVACCFCEDGGDWKASIMPIPWGRNGIDVLTTDLALWWLCMLGMSSRHNRALVKDEDVVRINRWDVVDLGGDRGWVRRHGYSGFEQPTDPPPNPDGTAPASDNGAAPPNPDSTASASGNLADFAGGVDLGFDENDWLNTGPDAGIDMPEAVDANDTNLGNFDRLNFHPTQ